MTQETMEIINPKDTMIPKDITKAINKYAHDWLISSRHTSHEARADSETMHTLALTAYAH